MSAKLQSNLTEEKKADEQVNPSEIHRFESGYVKMSQNGSDVGIYWAVFIPQKNQLLLYEEKSSLKPPKEIIYLSTCKKKTHHNCIILRDFCVGIDYKFEQYENDQYNFASNWFTKTVLFIEQRINEQIGDLLYTDESLLSARQQFNRFLLFQKKMADEQIKGLPKIVKAVRQAENGDTALKKHLTFLQKRVLDDEDKQIFGNTLAVRNMFWNLLIDTRNFINDDYLASMKVCGALARWDKISKQTTKLTEKDKKILVWGLNELSKFTKQEKKEKAQKLQKKWKNLSDKIVSVKEAINELQIKWQKKVEQAEKLSTICNCIGGLSIAAGLIGGALIGLGAITTAPAWVPYACGVAVVGGIAAICYGQTQKNVKKNVQRKLDDVSKNVQSYSHMLQDWVEAINLLEFPLWNIGLGDDDFKSEIDSWENMKDHEIDLLKTAKDSFGVFRDRCKNSLHQIRTIQQEIKL